MEFRLFLGVMVWSLLLGGILELVQHLYLSGRTGEPMDILADVVGAVVGLIAFRVMQGKQ